MRKYKRFNPNPKSMRRRDKKYESRAHTIALTIAVLGPLLNLVLVSGFYSGPPGMYLYWMVVLVVYILILIPFTYKSPLTLVRLIILGITIEDFSSHVWRSLIRGCKFLPFNNWYTQHFPFLGSLGEPTPLILIPRWYVVALALYLIITIIQFKKLFGWYRWRRRQEE